jgi:hypothetical protein
LIVANHLIIFVFQYRYMNIVITIKLDFMRQKIDFMRHV